MNYLPEEGSSYSVGGFRRHLLKVADQLPGHQ
jgi:hypothetical protein